MASDAAVEFSLLSYDSIILWPDGIRILALTIEVSQARAWAEGVRHRDDRDTEFSQRQLEERLDDVRRLLTSLGQHSSNAMVAAADTFAHALADLGDEPSEGPWPESENLKQVIRRHLRTDQIGRAHV